MKKAILGVLFLLLLASCDSTSPEPEPTASDIPLSGIWNDLNSYAPSLGQCCSLTLDLTSSLSGSGQLVAPDKPGTVFDIPITITGSRTGSSVLFTFRNGEFSGTFSGQIEKSTTLDAFVIRGSMDFPPFKTDATLFRTN